MRKKKDQEPEPELGFSAEGQGPLGLSGRRRVTPMDVQQKEFRLAFRGYNERDVDAFLDEITEEIAELLEENRRILEGSPAVGGSGDLVLAATREADEIVARAHDQAAEILRDAELRAASLGSGAPVPTTRTGVGEARAVSAFVSKEKEFLQSLASLIQAHAEAVKGIARRSRERPAVETPSEPEPATLPPSPVGPDSPGARIEAEPAAPKVTHAAESEAAAPVQRFSPEDTEGGTSGAPEAIPAPLLREPERGAIQRDEPHRWTDFMNEPLLPSREARGSSEESRRDALTMEVDEVRIIDSPAPSADVSGSSPAEPESEPASAGEESEQSLRELFWGED